MMPLMIWDGNRVSSFSMSPGDPSGWAAVKDQAMGVDQR